jgi:hypothetical protein
MNTNDVLLNSMFDRLNYLSNTCCHDDVPLLHFMCFTAMLIRSKLCSDFCVVAYICKINDIYICMFSEVLGH